MLVVGTYRVVDAGGGVPAVAFDGEVISAGVELRNDKEVLDFMMESARARGWTLSVIRNEGRIDRADAVVDPESIRFPASTLRLVDAIASRLSTLLRDRSATVAAKQGRTRVSDEDVFTSLTSVLEEISRQAGGEKSGV